jgi:DNA-binding response OmpR family regulator
MNAHQVIVNEETIALTSKEYAILEYLLLNQGVIISRERLMDHIWEYDYDGTSNIIDVYIRTLRKKIGKDAIETVRGVGYVIR